MNWNDKLYHSPFSHIYIEEKAYDYPVTRQILTRFPASTVIPVSHYMEVFSSHRQSFLAQKHSPKLLLAVKQEQNGGLVYPGAPVCQNFGYQRFYYTSSIMNCLYDCEYCYLQGMYASANLVVFVNLEDIFHQVEQLLQEGPVYLCISYDTDLLALESLFGYVRRWMDFTKAHPELTVECRTKSAYPIENLLLSTKTDNSFPNNTFSLTERFIFAWTLSPQPVIQNYEHAAPSLNARLHAVCQALKAGCRVRLCFDPVLRVPGWQELYREMLQTVFTALLDSRPECLTNGQLADVSLGTFRISKEYLGRMRRNRPDSPVVQYPFRTEAGVCSYGTDVDQEMMEWMKQQLLFWVPKERIFLWKEY